MIYTDNSFIPFFDNQELIYTNYSGREYSCRFVHYTQRIGAYEYPNGDVAYVPEVKIYYEDNDSYAYVPLPTLKQR